MEGIISLGVGEPDFKTPFHVRQAGIETLEKGKTWYTANAGLMDLRVEICHYLERRFTLTYQPTDEVVVTVGGSEAIDMAVRALVNPMDEVLIPEPSFVCYTPIVSMAGGVPVPIETTEADCFRLTAKQLKEKITDRTKLLILPFPNNPTGGVMRREHLAEIAEVLRGTDIMILSDEIYGELTYGTERHVSIAELDGMWERTVVVSGFSKAYAMTGWRLGYAVGPAPILTQINKLHQYSIMCAPSMSQYAAISALRDGDESIAHMVSEYDKRRRLLVRSFNDMGLPCFEPEGAFYVFPCIRSTGMTSLEFCEKLLQAKRVAVVPGDAFGNSGEGFIRVSYSYSLNHLLEATKRIAEFLNELKEAK